MPPRRVYITTSIPYVNARPHLGFALELVQADALARHRRLRGDHVRLLSGTDDNSLKNVLAAEAAGVPTADLVARNAASFADLADHLDVALDDFISTGSDPRHRPGVERLWLAFAAAGDLYRAPYEGLYWVGCEAFTEPAELVSGRCPEHETVPDVVREDNWFFRLSRHQAALEQLVASGRLRIVPAFRAREVLAFLRSGLRDLSVSRSVGRARGWGIPVPNDPGQVIYVWWDALASYVTALGYGTGSHEFRRWWLESDERVHVIGKGILRFHAVHWPAMLLSAGEPLPTTILVHEYVTAGGRKLSKSLGNVVEPAEVVARWGADALRWWLLREVAPAGDTDFTPVRLAARANADLANGVANLVGRTVAMVHRYRGGRVPDGPPGLLRGPLARTAAAVRAAVDAFDLRTGAGALAGAVAAANRLVNEVRPWALAREGREAELDAALAELVWACRELAVQAAPFLPGLAGRAAAQLGSGGRRLPPPAPLFPRLSQD